MDMEDEVKHIEVIHVDMDDWNVVFMHNGDLETSKIIYDGHHFEVENLTDYLPKPPIAFSLKYHRFFPKAIVDGNDYEEVWGVAKRELGKG